MDSDACSLYFECNNMCKVLVSVLLVHSVFVRINHCTVALMFVSLSVCLSGTGVCCDHTVHISADLR